MCVLTAYTYEVTYHNSHTQLLTQTQWHCYSSAVLSLNCHIDQTDYIKKVIIGYIVYEEMAYEGKKGT